MGAEANERPYLVTPFSRVQPEQVSWLWPPYIPLGKVTVIDGDPGLGKSTVTLDIVARLSRGDGMPDGSPGTGRPANSLLLSAEDGLADTIRPRLDAAGANPACVGALELTGTGEGAGFSIPEDLAVLKDALGRVSVSLVVIDPFFAYLSGGLNANSDQDVRRALRPLATVAEEAGTAIVLIRHLRKSASDSPLYRGGGSIGIIGAARSGLLVAQHPADRERRVFAPLKSNLARLGPSLGYHLEDASAGVARVVWDGQVPYPAESLLLPPLSSPIRGPEDILRESVANGPIDATEGLRLLAEAGFRYSPKSGTLTRLRKRSKVKTRKKGTIDGWEWYGAYLPPTDHILTAV